ncbi:MAG: PglZ domain-containing protein [Lachnoclostridium sp.]|nr:PglZ domain-containing protein [Lachnoclostridium sp.]
MNPVILWADDEIDLLKPHILFLRSKGYDVETVNNGRDALELVATLRPDLIILDENMPGLTGLETLQLVKQRAPQTPVIMITKSEEENIMDQAVGNKIADYLIKPVNPNQILLSIKKNLHSEELVSQKASNDYRKEFQTISSQINDSYSVTDWMELYRKIVFWEMELASAETNMDELLMMQKNEANSEFCKFIRKNYEKWVGSQPSDNRPEMSPDLFKTRVFPLLDKGEKVFFILIDNFRLDQWCMIKPLLTEYFNVDEQLYCSILPTATQYARNAIFSGLMPLDIEKMFPELWVDEDSPEGKNLNESPLIATQIERFRRRFKFSYTKINDSQGGEKLLREFSNIEGNDLNVIVFNFIDMLSHARTESKMIRELASNNAAYRSLTESWFRHSPALDIFKRIAAKGYKILLTTDHGTVRVDNPVKVVGDKNTNTNLRYKVGKNLNYNPRQVYEIKSPERFGLPSPNISSTYIFALNRDFFAYPNNYNYYVQYYDGTFQHGGVSMEEMLVPIITLDPKK